MALHIDVHSSVIGLNIHRSFAQVAVLDGDRICEERRVDLIHDRFIEFARTLNANNEVVIEATGNSSAVERFLRPFVRGVAIGPSWTFRC